MIAFPKTHYAGDHDRKPARQNLAGGCSLAFSGHAAVAAALVLFAVAAAAAPIAPDSGEQTADLAGTDIVISTYRPSKCVDPSLLLVFHGVTRNAAGYRDSARGLADRNCMIVVAPLFDKQRFPGWRYQRGGIVDRDAIQKPQEWTGNIVIDLVDWVRKQERRELNYSLIGHSAGGQFLSRVAAFVPTQARRIVIANPSTHVVPSLKVGLAAGMQRLEVITGQAARVPLRRVFLHRLFAPIAKPTLRLMRTSTELTQQPRRVPGHPFRHGDQDAPRPRLRSLLH